MHTLNKNSFHSSIVILIFLFSSASFGAGGNDDLFNSIDTKEKVPEKKSGFFGQIWSNAELKLSTTGMTYTRNPPPRDNLDDQVRVAEGRVELKTNYKGESNVFNFLGWGEAGTQLDTYRNSFGSWQEDERSRRYFELSEINWIYNSGSFEASLGKRIYKLGLSVIYSPLSKFTVADGNDPVSPKEIGDWMATTEILGESSKLSFIFLPVFMPSKIPSNRSRWYAKDSTEFNTDDVPGGKDAKIDRQIPDIQPKNFQGILRFKTTLSGWDFIVGLHQGLSSYGTLRKAPDYSDTNQSYKQDFVGVASGFLGFSTTTGSLELHGEGIYSRAYELKDDHYVQYVGGGTYTWDEGPKLIGLDNIEFTLEYGGEVQTQGQGNPDYVASSRKLRTIRKSVFWKSIFKVSEKLSFFQGGTVEFDPVTGESLAAGFQYKIFDGFISKLAYEHFDGQPDSYFIKFRDNRRVVLHLEYTL